MLRKLTHTTILFCITIAVVFSCKSSSYKNEIESLDSLQLSLTNAKEIFDSIPYDSVSYYWDVFNHYIRQIQQIKIDIDNDEDRATLQLFGAMKSPLRDFLRDKKKTSDDIDYTLKQLHDLKADLARNSISAEKAPEYIETETYSAQVLILKIQKLSSEAAWLMTEVKRMSPEVEKVLEQYQN